MSLCSPAILSTAVIVDEHDERLVVEAVCYSAGVYNGTAAVSAVVGPCWNLSPFTQRGKSFLIPVIYLLFFYSSFQKY